ncbi:hypothetical protein ACNKHW_00690 [Shigella flexneri]
MILLDNGDISETIDSIVAMSSQRLSMRIFRRSLWKKCGVFRAWKNVGTGFRFPSPNERVARIRTRIHEDSRWRNLDKAVEVYKAKEEMVALK